MGHIYSVQDRHNEKQNSSIDIASTLMYFFGRSEDVCIRRLMFSFGIIAANTQFITCNNVLMQNRRY